MNRLLRSCLVDLDTSEREIKFITPTNVAPRPDALSVEGTGWASGWSLRANERTVVGGRGLWFIVDFVDLRGQSCRSRAAAGAWWTIFGPGGPARGLAGDVSAARVVAVGA